MGKMNINLLATIVPLAIVAVGLIGWVTTLRGDLNAAQGQLAEVRSDIVPLQEEAKQCAIEIHNLHELIKDIDKIALATYGPIPGKETKSSYLLGTMPEKFFLTILQAR